MTALPHELVLDASCAVKWFTEEDNTQNALRILGLHRTARVTLFAPDLLVYEVLNALRFKPNVTQAYLKAWAKDLFDLQLNLLSPTTDLLQHAIALALKHNSTIYDAIYLALAENLGIKLITADTQFSAKINQPERIILLKDISI